MIPLRQRRVSSELVTWRLVAPKAGESFRWERFDGRWVSLFLCAGDDFSQVRVEDSSGRRALTDSYEEALALARDWQR